MPSPLIPVTVLTGFLGAGKTTLLNRILAGQHGKKIAVIENEFGEVGVDNQLVIQADEEIFEMYNGCICCTVRGDLIRILNRLAKRSDRLDGVIIETTGLANPGPVALTFFSDPEVRAAYRLDGIVTLVDARHIHHHWDECDEAKKQIAFADVILLNKIDLMPSGALDVVERRIQQMNPAARLHRTQQAEISLGQVIDLGGFNLERATALDPQFLEPEYPFEWGGVFELSAGMTELHLEAGPDPTMKAVLLPLQGLDLVELGAVREKAVLAFSETTQLLQPNQPLPSDGAAYELDLQTAPVSFPIQPSRPGLHALFTQHHPDEFSASVQKAGQPLAPQWSHNFKPNHSHDDTVGSVGITFSGDLDSTRLNAWLAELFQAQGKNIYRSKGVLAVRGSEKRLVFQGVHMLFDAKFDRPWGSETRTNTFVFIGRELDRAALVAGFQRCLAR